MKTKELIETLRICGDDDIICPACERYDTMGIVGGTFACCGDLMLKAAEALERLDAELKNERYRHDRLQDFEVAEAEELAKIKEERDSLLATLKHYAACESCVHWDYEHEICTNSKNCVAGEEWTWRGVCRDQ